MNVLCGLAVCDAGVLRYARCVAWVCEGSERDWLGAFFGKLFPLSARDDCGEAQKAPRP